ncbi:hypothetical protein [uncultured Secundilactobacillus sp.]|uniref:hypothetical protein n=1 Tax=uncultured Secundilactobacillus sp. TaxID=2813935 RepID=UPI00258863E3|nr:hypothetical protein [uncultured Secundilactobacillus sp.]
MNQIENPFLQHLQELQDLKFMIAADTDHRLTYQNFRIFDIQIDALTINLVAEYHRYKNDNELATIARLIVEKYRL